MSVASKQWFTAADLAALTLPGLSRVKRKINERATRERWALRNDTAGAPLARPSGRRGGGLEYHQSLLPASARVELAKRGVIPANDEPDASPQPVAEGRSWAWFENQSGRAKVEAQRRAAAVALVDELERSGLSRSAAVACAAGQCAIAASTLWNWLAMLEGIDPADRLPHLAPRRTGGGAEAEVDESAWRFFLSDYLRPEQPTLTSCYERLTRDYAAPRGIAIPHRKTLQRKLEREVDARLIVAKREGAEALRRTLPPQQRSVKDLHALEVVNIDGHKFDVFTQYPDGRIGRPIMVAIQDIYSRKILAWRIGETESAVLTRLAFADLFRRWGIPSACVLDNGRAFASKWISGGAKSRFRFKIREEEPTGILTALGIAIHWAMPYRGQSKPIERSFRDLCDTVAKHPALAGAYTGNGVSAKPENYGSRAVPIEAFLQVAERGINAHNARLGRRSEVANGRSFDQAFEQSYTTNAIGRASAEQLRLALLAADEVRTDRQSGAIGLFGNRYWASELAGIAGKRVTVRFDPDDLTQPVHVYDRQGKFLTTVPLLEQTGFLDAGAAKARARQERELRKTARRLEELQDLIDVTDLAAMLPQDDDALELEPAVLRPVRHRGQTAAALKAAPGTRPDPVFIDRFSDSVARLRLVE